MIFKKLKNWWQSIRYYVIAALADNSVTLNSVTLSKALFNHIKDNAGEKGSATKRVKLSVSIHQLKKKGKIYYQFEKPHAEHIRKHPKG